MTSNEIRQVIGMKPSDDPKADQLVNSNISQPNGDPGMIPPEEEAPMDEGIPMDEAPIDEESYE